MMQATLGEKILSQTCIWSKLHNSLGLWVLENHYYHSEPLFPEPPNGSSNSIFPVGLLQMR